MLVLAWTKISKNEKIIFYSMLFCEIWERKTYFKGVYLAASYTSDLMRDIWDFKHGLTAN